MHSPELEKRIEKNKRNRTRLLIFGLVSIAILLLGPRLWAAYQTSKMEEAILDMPPKDALSSDQPGMLADDPSKSFITVYISEKKYFKLDGKFEEGVQASDFEEIQLSDNALKKSAESPIIIIKSTASSSYKSLVDLLDTLGATQYPRYTIDSLTQAERALVPE